MRDILDLDRYPLDQPDTAAWLALVEQCKSDLARDGLFNLPGFVRPGALDAAVKEVQPYFEEHSFLHARRHNIYFKKTVDGLDPAHPALQQFETSNRTVCGDQIGNAIVVQLYEWAPFARFLAATMDKEQLYTMDDPLARINVMAYREGQALNWHFDRSVFTTTLLLQSPESGGAFEYAKDLRSDDDPNYAGVADLVEGRSTPVHMAVEPGTLNIFKGKNTAHRVTKVHGDRARIITVYSYYDKPGVCFTEEERIGFFGRAH